MHDEGPSVEDIERFSSHETGYCPRCGEEVWDDISKCPSCGIWMQQGASHRIPESSAFRKKCIVFIVVLLLVGFIYSVLRLF
ncbi:MAG: hypothetical protein H8E86_05950 [Planctomycetes bacterium]|nr:hypothetical protein [Planctomycetota bacterium]